MIRSRDAWIALGAGLLPIAAAHGAWLLNLAQGSLPAEFHCLPYLEGCISISRAARSGPGLALFRALTLPAALCLALTWWSLRSLQPEAFGRTGRWMSVLGLAGAIFLVFYVTALGHETEWYRWQRRYGVTLYFGGTALAQLLLVWILWPLRGRLLNGRLRRPVVLLTALVSLQWALGVFSAVKRLIFSDPELVDRLENISEWWFAMAMSLAFLAIAVVLSRCGSASVRPGDRPD